MAAELLEALYDSNLTVSARLGLVQDAADRNRTDTVNTVFQFLDAPARGEAGPDWDPAVENRYLKIALIAALDALNERSRQGEIISHIRAASGHASSPMLEMQAAAIAIADIGEPRLLRQVIELGRESGSRVVYNAVRTLELLNLPQPATHPPMLHYLGPALQAEVTVEVSNLAAYLEKIRETNKRAVKFSPATDQWLGTEGSSYVIGDGESESVEIEDVFDSELQLYGLTYAFADDSIVIETMPEAIARWERWWKNLAEDDVTRLVIVGQFLRTVRDELIISDEGEDEEDEGDEEDSEEEHDLIDDDDLDFEPDD